MKTKRPLLPIILIILAVLLIILTLLMRNNKIKLIYYLNLLNSYKVPEFVGYESKVEKSRNIKEKINLIIKNEPNLIINVKNFLNKNINGYQRFILIDILTQHLINNESADIIFIEIDRYLNNPPQIKYNTFLIMPLEKLALINKEKAIESFKKVLDTKDEDYQLDAFSALLGPIETKERECAIQIYIYSLDKVNELSKKVAYSKLRKLTDENISNDSIAWNNWFKNKYGFNP